MEHEALAELIQKIVRERLAAPAAGGAPEAGDKISIGVSNRHVHVNDRDLTALFGPMYELKKIKDLSQPGQYAADEKVTLVGPKGVLENVRILGPVRDRSQVEISQSDAFKLGVKPPVRDSGDLKGSAGLTLVGPHGSVTLREGVIIAARHIHMHPDDAARYGVKDGQRVQVEIGKDRGAVYNNVLIRVNRNYRLEMHIDTDEANAVGARNGDLVKMSVPAAAR